MELRHRIGERIAQQLTDLRGTRGSFTVDVADTYYQAASYWGNDLLIEVASEQFLHRPPLPVASHEELVRLGFTRPSGKLPNWSIRMKRGRAEDIFVAANATVSALVDVFEIDPDELAAAVGLPVEAARPEPTLPTPTLPPTPTAGEGEPLVVGGSLGELRLYPNGFATLDGQAWADHPVRDWSVNSDDNIGITLEPAADHSFPNIAIIENTEQAVAVLRQFTPSQDERRVLARRLAVAEYYPLTCILTGTIYHCDLGRAVWDLEREHRDYPAHSIVGWPLAQRLESAVDAARGLYQTQSADNNHELRSDERATWRAIQKWVRISPWRDDFDFEIKPAERLPFQVVPGPELEIQRVH